jgi:hypothetical protein
MMRERVAVLLTAGIIVALLCTPAVAIEGWVSLETVEPGATISLQVTSVTEEGFVSNAIIPGFYAETVELAGSTWDRIVLPGAGYLGVVGSPNLPVIRRLFAADPVKDARVVIENVEYDVIKDVRVEPAQALLLETQIDADQRLALDEKQYSADVFFPEAWAEASIDGIMHGVRIGRVDLHVFRYNPVQRVLQVARRIDFRVEFVGEQPFCAIRYGVKGVPENLETSLRSLLLNYPYLNQPVRELDTAVDYLIIADPALINAGSLAQLVAHHQNQGRTVLVVSVAQIGTTAGAIKAFIQTEYNSHAPAALDYVLLVGDAAVIPYKTNANPSAQANLNSDIWYAWLEGADIFGDVGLGRFPAQNVQELDRMIAKTLAFAAGGGAPWQRRALLVANKEQYPQKYTACKESIYTASYAIQPQFDRMYGGDPGASWTNASLTSSVNSGYGVVNYRGHGGNQNWSSWNLSGQSYTVADVQGLANGAKTPIVFSIACWTANMAASQACLGEAFLREDDAAVAFLGAMHPSYTLPNHDFDRSLFQGAWSYGVLAIGDLLNWANADMYATYGGGSAASANITMYLWFGDPALKAPAACPMGFQIQRWATNQGGFSPSQRWFTGDFNGDGKTDFAKFWDDGGSWTCDVHLSTGSSFVMSRWATKQGGYWSSQEWFTGDFNGDGKTDFAKFWNDSGSWTCDVHLSTGSLFAMSRWATTQGCFSSSQRWFTGDFNGDKKTDFAKFWDDSGSWTCDVHLSTGTSFAMSRWATQQGGFWASQQWFTGDFNGDGKTDFAKFWGDFVPWHHEWTCDVHVSNGSAFTKFRWATKQGWFWSDQKWVVGDFNGDGRDDFAKFWGDQVGAHQEWVCDVHLSNGSAFAKSRWATHQGWYWTSQAWFAGDFDGDGRDDLAKFWGDQVGSHEEWVADVHRSTSSGFVMERWATHQGWFWSDQVWVTGDFDGDGREDFAKFWGNPVGGGLRWTCDVHLSRCQ